MDESVQKQIELALGQREHWVWMYPPGHEFYGTCRTPGRCHYCDEQYPQPLEVCELHHRGANGGHPICVEPPPR